MAKLAIIGLENQSSRWPRSSVTSRRAEEQRDQDEADEIDLEAARHAAPCARFISAGGSSTNMPTSVSDRMPIGTLIRNTQCQE